MRSTTFCNFCVDFQIQIYRFNNTVRVHSRSYYRSYYRTSEYFRDLINTYTKYTKRTTRFSFGRGKEFALNKKSRRKRETSRVKSFRGLYVSIFTRRRWLDKCSIMLDSTNEIPMFSFRTIHDRVTSASGRVSVTDATFVVPRKIRSNGTKVKVNWFRNFSSEFHDSPRTRFSRNNFWTFVEWLTNCQQASSISHSARVFQPDGIGLRAKNSLHGEFQCFNSSLVNAFLFHMWNMYGTFSCNVPRITRSVLIWKFPVRISLDNDAFFREICSIEKNALQFREADAAFAFHSLDIFKVILKVNFFSFFK